MKEYKQLSLEERKELFLMKKESIGVKEIAKSLGRHHTAIRRELK